MESSLFQMGINFHCFSFSGIKHIYILDSKRVWITPFRTCTQQKIQARNGVIQTRWNLKNENRHFSIRWTIVKQIPAGRNEKRNCSLCLEEKLMITKGRSKNILSRRSELFSKCRHVI